MNYHDKRLLEREDYKTMAMPLALYCALSDCQTLMHKGTPAKRYSATEYTHISCPPGKTMTRAIHKMGEPTMSIGVSDGR